MGEERNEERHIQTSFEDHEAECEFAEDEEMRRHLYDSAVATTNISSVSFTDQNTTLTSVNRF